MEYQKEVCEKMDLADAVLQQLENIIKSKGGNVSLVGKDKVLYIIVNKGQWNIEQLNDISKGLINPRSDYYKKGIRNIVIEEF